MDLFLPRLLGEVGLRLLQLRILLELPMEVLDEPLAVDLRGGVPSMIA